MIKNLIIKTLILFLITVSFGIFDIPFAEAKNTPPSWVQLYFRFRNDDGSETAATWKAAEDTNITGQAKSTNFRLRFVTQESANANPNVSVNPRIEYKAASGGACTDTSGWTTITTSTSNAFALSASSQFTDGDATTQQLSAPGGHNFVAGKILESTNPAGATGTMGKSVTEHEWSMQATTNAGDGTAYIFRITDNGTALNTYTVCPQVTVAASNTLPVASSVSIDSAASSVTLTENTTTTVSCVGTVTDSDGFADITSVTADFYRTSVGIGGGEDNNNYYQLVGDSECVPSGGSGNTETYTCNFSVQYYADPTDAGSPNAADDWTCNMTPSDGVGAGTSASDTIEIDSLLAINVTSSIDYGTVNANTDTGATNQTTTVTNTGNRALDTELSGTQMSSGGDNISVDNQEYSLTSFTYGAGTSLSGTPTFIETVLAQPTAGTVPVTDDILWGVGVPNGTPAGTYTGTNTFTAIAD